MKGIYFIGLMVLLLAQDGFSQEPATPQRRQRNREQETTRQNAPSLSERAKINNEVQSKAPEHVVWLREIYREIDLNKEVNTPLYYPVQPIGERMNLFSLVFKLLSEGTIKAYKYRDSEVFTDDEKLNFEDILKKYQILYSTEGSGDATVYKVDPSDVPSAEVLKYLIKEGWYFDAATGTFKSQVIALCPLMLREDFDTGQTTPEALFWLPYDIVRPYLSRMMIMTSNFNNNLTYTIDDYFTKGMYSGDIVKTVNLKNQPLRQQVGSDPEALKHAQDSIESQLKMFHDTLWVKIPPVIDKKAKKKAEKEKKKAEEAAAKQ